MTPRHVAGLRRAIAKASTEPDLQAYLQKNPRMLVQHLGGGHGRWVLPQTRLGTQHVTDFLISQEDSTGRSWVAVELEGPQRRMFNKSGDPSRYLWHAIRQILDWRVWLECNRDYAVRSPDQDGLGLDEISPTLPGLIVIGRRRENDRERRMFRRALAHQLNIEIHSYDWLVDTAEGRVNALAAYRSKLAER